MLEQMFQVSRIVKHPIAMFVNQGDWPRSRPQVDAGVSAYHRRTRERADEACSGFVYLTF